MSSWRRGFYVRLIVAGVVASALAPAAFGWATSAGASRLPAACSIKDFGNYVVRPGHLPRGVYTPITISAENISRKTCTVGCRDTPVGVRILDTRKRLVTDLGVLPAAGCPRDPASADGVVHWPIKPGQTYDQSRAWNQGICTDSGCRALEPGNYIIEVRWTRPGGSTMRSAKIRITQEPECPDSRNIGPLAEWCARTPGPSS